jgi:hypothetical protein
MAGLSRAEIAAELRRREQGQRDIETRRSERAERNRIANADTECVHCHTPYESAEGGGGGLCDLCLYAD